MPFNLKKLLRFCVAEIRHFASKHPDEDFYAFAISGSWLCLNSEQRFAKKVKECQEEWDYKLRPIDKWEDLTEEDLHREEFMLGCRQVDRSDRRACLAAINERREELRKEGFGFRNPTEITELRENTGDWAYEGFADMVKSGGFAEEAYEKHWYLSDEEQRTSEYGLAMDALLEQLHKSGGFTCLKTVAAFHATRVEHNY